MRTKHCHRRKDADLRIGLLVERQRAYGRRLCEGAAAYAMGVPGLSLGMLEWSDLLSGCHLDGYDAFVVRVLDDRMEKVLRRTGKPVVDVFYGKDRAGFAVADLDNAAIAKLAVDHFLSRGFRSFAYCGYDGIRFSDVRRDTFAELVRQAGFACRVFKTPAAVVNRFAEAVVRSEVYAPQRGERRPLIRWLERLPPSTAVFCSHDLRAHQVLELCHEAGIAVPQRLAILGVDDDAILCGFTSPTLSSIDPDGFATGREAIRMAERLVREKGAKGTPPQTFIPPKGLVARSSTEIYPLDPAWLSDALIFIRRNATKGIGPHEVFAYLGLSHTTVGKAFKTVRSTTVLDEIRRVRLAEACRLLSSTDLNLAAVAKQSGFSSAPYLCRAFAAVYGTGPGEWRRNADK